VPIALPIGARIEVQAGVVHRQALDADGPLQHCAEFELHVHQRFTVEVAHPRIAVLPSEASPQSEGMGPLGYRTLPLQLLSEPPLCAICLCLY
jgi:hypothetical protein